MTSRGKSADGSGRRLNSRPQSRFSTLARLLGGLAIACVLVWPGAADAQDAAPAKAAAAQAATASPWYTVDASDNVQLNLHLFWAIGCPHCKKERAYLDKLTPEFSWLKVVEHEVSKEPENVRTLLRMAKEAGGSTSLVPTTFVCNQMTVGYQSDATTGDLLRDQAIACYKRIIAERGGGGKVDVASFATDSAIAPIELPLIGTFDPGSISLPVLTMAIATVDSFNPCGLFILLMLMSMMIRARSRVQMAVIGGSFALTWGAMYLALMAAWLSLFEYVGDLSLITTFAGIIVLIMATINFKDFLGIKAGPSLSMRPGAKHTLFARMGDLVRRATQVSSVAAHDQSTGALRHLREFTPLIVGTTLMTLSAGGYAILCTTGFAMTYTRILTMHNLPALSYVLYLIAYVVVYLIPMSLIVVAFTVTLGSRKLSDAEGRALKLLAAIMLSGLGVVLIGAPDLVKNPLIVVMLMLAAFVVTAVVINAEKAVRTMRQNARAGRA